MPRLGVLILLAAKSRFGGRGLATQGTSADPGAKMHWTNPGSVKIQRVEGIAELAGAAAVPLERFGASGGGAALLAGVAAGFVALAGGGWYARRRWLQRQRDIQRVRERANRCRFERYPSIRSVPVDKEGPA